MNLINHEEELENEECKEKDIKTNSEKDGGEVDIFDDGKKEVIKYPKVKAFVNSWFFQTILIIFTLFGLFGVDV